MYKIFLLLIITLLCSCTSTETEELDRKMAVRLVFSKTDGFYNRLDSIVVTRLATWPDSTNLNNIGLDGIEIDVTNTTNGNSYNLEFDQTAKGVYKTDNNFRFDAKVNFRVKFTDPQGNYDPMIASYYVSDNVYKLSAGYKINGTWQELSTSSQNIIHYYRSVADSSREYIKLIKQNGAIDSLKMEAATNPIPQQYWLEDTTAVVWNNYPAYIRKYKQKNRYGKFKSFAYGHSYVSYIELWNSSFYHSGANYLTVYFNGFKSFDFINGFGSGKMLYSTSSIYPLYIYNYADKATN